MTHISEEQLIAYQIGEDQDRDPIREHLELCAECSALSESIAETLRIFSAEPVPQVNADHAWQRLRGSLPVLSPQRRRSGGRPSWRFIWAALGFAAAALLLIAFIGLSLHHGVQHRRGDLAVQRPGPLTDRPSDAAIANHLDSAERLLTEVNHASGPLDETTRTQAHDLLLKNAVYIHKAHDDGDLAEASVLENLGRVLTTLDHETSGPGGGWHIRLEMNTDGLLLDIRILRQNDFRQ